MLYRKKVILAIMNAVGGNVTAKCMQKYLFIFTKKRGSERLYDFVPYKYGCFSFQANQDIISLSRSGIISIVNEENTECRYKLNFDERYIETLDMFDAMAVNYIKDNFVGISQNELIAYTYRTWPFTAINSVIKERILTNDELKKVDSFRDRYKQDYSALMTIGYEGFSLESYLRQLICNDIHVLVDVRKNAFSMKYGFSKGILSKACLGVGIEYVHVPQLGIESHLRQTLNTQADYDVLFNDYEKTTLLENRNYLLYVREIINSKKRVCLTCFEKDPKQCHRTRVANALMSLQDVDYKFNEILL
jgi:uncharacterized protein (DUF488 family)